MALCPLGAPCTGQSKWQGLGGCSTHVWLRLCPIQVGVEQHGDVAVAGLQRDGDSVVTILGRAGERSGRALGLGAGGSTPGSQLLTLSTMEMLQAG